MKCQNCDESISPTFVAAIRENKCPACGQPCLSEKEHTELFSVVTNITSVVTDISNDTVVKMAVAMHGKFDIFPKGVVVDNVVAKEVIYVTAAPQAPVYNPMTGFVPALPPQPYSPPLKNQMRSGHSQGYSQPAQPQPNYAMPQSQREKLAQLVSQFENQHSDDDGLVTTLTAQDLEMEEQRKTRELMNKHRRDSMKRGS